MTPNVGYAWQKKDAHILLPASKGKRLSVLGLMTPDCKLFSRIFEGSINSDSAIAVLGSTFVALMSTIMIGMII
ncbi:MAG: hypothetical protein SNH35_07885 [Rikenellaceae bacterium]